jgi:hypothetical protein
MKFIKTVGTVERYDLKQISHDYSWATFFIDETDGTFMVQSDWGSFSYQWTHIGNRTLKEFLIGLSISVEKGYPDYLTEKLTGGKEVFDCDATIVKLKEILTNLRDKGKIHPDDCQEMLEIFEGDFEHTTSIDYFCTQLYNDDHLWNQDRYGEMNIFSEGELPFVMVHPSSALSFVKECFPKFCNILREELGLIPETSTEVLHGA